MDFGEKLKVVCAESGLKLKEISELSGIYYSQLKNYNQGRVKPKIDKIQKIAAIPQLEPWREFLLETDLEPDESEIMILLARLRKQGKESEALAILREIAGEDGE